MAEMLGTRSSKRILQPWAAGVRVACLALFSLGILACGGSPEPTESAPATEPETAVREAEYEQHINDLEIQLESLARQSEAMRREVLSRLDQIDVTREALAVQLSNLQGRAEVSAEIGAAPVAAKKEAAKPSGETTDAVPATTPAATTTGADESPFLRFLLLIFILAAIFFLGRIFFDRWGDPEDGERPPSVETTTDLGKIRFPPGTEAHPDDDDMNGGDAIEDDEDEGRPGD